MLSKGGCPERVIERIDVCGCGGAGGRRGRGSCVENLVWSEDKHIGAGSPLRWNFDDSICLAEMCGQKDQEYEVEIAIIAGRGRRIHSA